MSHFVVWKHNTSKKLFHALIYRHFLFIQFAEVTRGGHQTHDHIWEEPSLWLCKQTTHVDNPQIVKNKNSFLISCSVWSFAVMLCTKDIFSCLKQYVKAAYVSDYSQSIPRKLGMLSWVLWFGGTKLIHTAVWMGGDLFIKVPWPYPKLSETLWQCQINLLEMHNNA